MEDIDLKEIYDSDTVGKVYHKKIVTKSKKSWYTKQPENECVTYNLHKPISWKQFKAMPDEIKKMYITSLQERFSVPDTEIAKMMHCDNSSLSKYRRKLQIPRVHTRELTKEQVTAWQSFLAQDKDFVPQNTEAVITAVSPSIDISKELAVSKDDVSLCKEPEDLTLANVALEFCGYMNADAIVKKIAALFPASCRCRVKISIEVEEESE